MLRVVLGFIPFIAFALLTRVIGVDLSLWAAAAISAFFIARGRMTRASPKMLEIGTVALFACLALFTTITQTRWSLPLVRLVVDIGLLAIILLSIALRQPFTLQYAREQVPPDVQKSPIFLQVNDRISAVWALALAVGVAGDFAMQYWPVVPIWLDVVAIVAALIGAVRFTQWYPEEVRKRYLSASGGA